MAEPNKRCCNSKGYPNALDDPKASLQGQSKSFKAAVAQARALSDCKEWCLDKTYTGAGLHIFLVCFASHAFSVVEL